MAPWLALQADLVGVLRGLPGLVGGASRAQLWGLAQEYLDLALRLALVDEQRALALSEYSAGNAFAAEETQVVLQLATTYAAELSALLPAADHAFKSDIRQVVWFDDGETIPGLWLHRFYPNVPVQVFQLPRIEGALPWRQLAEALQQPGSPRAVALQLAPDETAQAQQAAQQVINWLNHDADTEIAVAVLDRLAARRLVGLLADCGVLVDDRTGWRLSTANVAGWFDRVLNQFAGQGQISTLTQPFTGLQLEGFQPWAFGKRGEQHTLSQWAFAFHALLERSALLGTLGTDEAGKQLLALLQVMQQVNAETAFDAHEFLAAWRHWAEAQRFRPLDIESPVRLVPLLSTRMRTFKRVLVLGCAQSHFQESPPGLLPPVVAQELGFPGPRMARIQKVSALHELLCNSQQVTLLHAAQVGGKPETLLPELIWLDILLREPDALQAHWSGFWHRQPDDTEIPVNEQPEQALTVGALPNRQSVPAAIKVTALDDWVACRLRFGLQHALPWPPQRESAAMRYEQLRGIFVHKVLENTASDMAMAGQPVDSLQAWKNSLLDHAQAVWHELELADRATVYPFLRFFEQIVPRVAGKLMERHIDGWRFKAAERQVEHALPLQAGGMSIHLKGRVDRLDERAGALAISDIKFTSPNVLKKRLQEPLSQPQLPAYQAMLGDPSARLYFFGLHKDKVDWLEFPELPEEYSAQGYRSWGEVLMAELSTALDRFFETDEPWQANPGEACTWCPVHGVCRPQTLAGADRLLDGQELEDE